MAETTQGAGGTVDVDERGRLLDEYADAIRAQIGERLSLIRYDTPTENEIRRELRGRVEHARAALLAALSAPAPAAAARERVVGAAMAWYDGGRSMTKFHDLTPLHERLLWEACRVLRAAEGEPTPTPEWAARAGESP
jgi:hypothetical protein